MTEQLSGFVQPGSPLNNSVNQKVRLYFVGVEWVAANGGKDITIYAKDAAWTMPPLGDYIEVSPVIAKDLVFKSRWNGAFTLVPAQEGGERIAQAIKAAIARDGVATTETIRSAQLASIVDTLDEKALEEALTAKRSKSKRPSIKLTSEVE